MAVPVAFPTATGKYPSKAVPDPDQGAGAVLAAAAAEPRAALRAARRRARTAALAMNHATRRLHELALVSPSCCPLLHALLSHLMHGGAHHNRAK